MDELRVLGLKHGIAGAADAYAGEVSAGRLFGILTPPAYAVPDAAAFGNTPGASECHTAWGAMAGTADLAARRLLGALRVDVERLGQVVFSFQTTDHESADQLNSAGPTLTFISSHVHSNSDRFSGEWNDEVRGRQLNQVVDYAAGIAGPVAVGSDDNVSRVPGEREDYDQDGVAALNRYGAEGFQDVGGVGPTIGDKAIDHIHASGVPAGEPTLVDGGPSDHDGQAVSYRLADW